MIARLVMMAGSSDGRVEVAYVWLDLISVQGVGMLCPSMLDRDDIGSGRRLISYSDLFMLRSRGERIRRV